MATRYVFNEPMSMIHQRHLPFLVVRQKERREENNDLTGSVKEFNKLCSNLWNCFYFVSVVILARELFLLALFFLMRLYMYPFFMRGCILLCFCRS